MGLRRLDLHSDLMPSCERIAEGEGLVVERRRTAAAARRAVIESIKEKVSLCFSTQETLNKYRFLMLKLAAATWLREGNATDYWLCIARAPLVVIVTDDIEKKTTFEITEKQC